MDDFVIETRPDDPDPAARDVLYHLLGDDNSRRTGLPDRQGFSVLLRDPATGAVIGGLWGVDDCGWAYIDLLFVPDVLQGRGLGARLVAEAESIARRRSMAGIWVNTYDFQAAGFYGKLGYEVFGTLDRVGEAAGQVFLKKYLQPA